MFDSIFNTATITMTQILISLGVSFVCGLLIALTYKVCTHSTKSFTTTLTILPMIVMGVILMVNGNLGVGVAVAGSFSLVRFRSIPGKASDIAIVFLAMASGLACGTGYVVFALLLSLVVSVINVICNNIPVFDAGRNYRTLKITIPEDLDYSNTFDDILNNYTSKYRLNGVKTVSLGTMFLLTYEIELKDTNKEKEMIDALRCRNGNLQISSLLKADEVTDL